MRVAVIGAGGIGGYFGASLARAGHDVHFLARGAHLEVIQASGLRVVEPAETWSVRVAASARVQEIPRTDFAIVAVKSYSLSEVADASRELAFAGAVIVPLLNGVEAFETLAGGGVPPEAIVPGLAVISVERSAPGEITLRSAFKTVVLGEHGGGRSDRADAIVAAFSASGIDARASEGIAVDLWRKFLFLASMAAACGLARAPIGPVRIAPLGRRLLERAVAEIAAVARARGVALPPGEEERVLERMSALPAAMKPSFLLDIERGGPTELDVLSGAVSRYGRAAGVDTPIHDAVTAAISASLRFRQPEG
ncbi:MAG: ketopantoate reductase family protein [Acidobacteria bacterium]|nr:ketopantoate reductase family protein [Acidobacteriota bacterium]MCA1612438.1 ketopantoate reductase family protein [Acidobacteriota bacterium]